MALSDIIIPTRLIKVGSAEFSVRGITFDDLSILIQDHRDDLERVVDSFVAMGDNPNPVELATTLLREMPVLVAKVIACASDEPEGWSTVRRLPLPTQLDALLAVGQLTFEETGGVKKFMADALMLVGGLNATLSQTPSAMSLK